MNQRTPIPAPDRHASCPNDGLILNYYKGVFESVYILLHPFLRPKSIPIERFYSNTWPTKDELIIGTEIVTWDEILQTSMLSTIKEIDIGLRTNILGLKEEFQNVEFEGVLCDLTDNNNVFHPTAGKISPFIENSLYKSLRNLGYGWLWVGDEFCTKRNLLWIDDLEKGDQIPSHGCVFTPDKKVLITTHWDSHFSFLCSSKTIINKILEYHSLEGFYCSPSTEVFWSLR